MSYITTKIIIPASDKYKQQPVHIQGKVVCKSYAVTSDPGFTKILKLPVCVADNVLQIKIRTEQHITDVTKKCITPAIGTEATQKHNPTLGAMFQKPKKQLTADQKTALALKHITLDSILVEYKFSNCVEQIAGYIIGLNAYNAFSADQRDLLCNKVMQIMSDNDLPYSSKVASTRLGAGLSTGLSIVPASESGSNSTVVTVAEFRSTILASADKAVWVSLDSVLQIVGNHALGNSVLAHKMAVNKDLKGHNLLIIDSGVAGNTNIIKVTDVSDNQSSIATIDNIKGALVAAGSKKALWFDYSSLAQGLGINLNVLSTAEADKVIKQYLERNGVFIVYKGTTATGESSIRLGFTKPIKAKPK